jgi:hypothetical protein
MFKGITRICITLKDKGIKGDKGGDKGDATLKGDKGDATLIAPSHPTSLVSLVDDIAAPSRLTFPVSL